MIVRAASSLPIRFHFFTTCLLSVISQLRAFQKLTHGCPMQVTIGDNPTEMLQLLDSFGFEVWRGTTQLLSWAHEDTWKGRTCGSWKQIPPSAFDAVAVSQPFGFQLVAIRSREVLAHMCGEAASV